MNNTKEKNTQTRYPDEGYVEAMDYFITKLKKQKEISINSARKDAKEALIRTGVATKNGKTKNKIVSWD